MANAKVKLGKFESTPFVEDDREAPIMQGEVCIGALVAVKVNRGSLLDPRWRVGYYVAEILVGEEVVARDFTTKKQAMAWVREMLK